MMQIQRATKNQSKARVALIGPTWRPVIEDRAVSQVLMGIVLA